MQTQSTQTLQQAYRHLQHLPKVEQKKVFGLIDALLQKNQIQDKSITKRRKAGTLPGKVVFADDFDEPLEDFKDYM